MQKVRNNRKSLSLFIKLLLVLLPSSVFAVDIYNFNFSFEVPVESAVVLADPFRDTIKYETPGNYTFTVPAGVTSVTATIVGGGGGGGGSDGGGDNHDGGSGGSGGAIITTVIDVTGMQYVPVTVGIGGTAAGWTYNGGWVCGPSGTTGNRNGSVGGGSSFGSYSVTGGGPGLGSTSDNDSGVAGVGGTPNGVAGVVVHGDRNDYHNNAGGSNNSGYGNGGDSNGTVPGACPTKGGDGAVIVTWIKPATASFNSSPNCIIPSGATSCVSPISWTTSNVNTAVLTDCVGGIYASSGEGSQTSTVTVPYNTGCYQIHKDTSDGQLLATISGGSSCITGTSWAGNKCTPNERVCISFGSTSCSPTGVWTAPTCPTACGYSASDPTYSCVGGNGTCSTNSPATLHCNPTASCIPAPTGVWTAPTCPTTCGLPASVLDYSCVGGNGLCSTNSPANLTCNATVACTCANGNIDYPTCVTPPETVQTVRDEVDTYVRGTCFIAGTKITMSDGSLKNIEKIEVGDVVMTSDGPHKTLKKYVTPKKGYLYAFNGDNNYFVTGGHPFMTTGGWKVLDAEIAKRKDLGISVSLLEVGDEIIKKDGSHFKVQEIDKKFVETTVYNFNVDIAHDYFANDFWVHNRSIDMQIAE